MSYNTQLAGRIRKILAGRKGFSEKMMFGGMSFMLNGKMCCGVIHDDLVVRVEPERFEKVLSNPHTRPMDFTGRPLQGFVYVDPRGYKTDKDLAEWIKLGINFVKYHRKKRKRIHGSPICISGVPRQ